jgi:hypothetical protein
VVQIAVAQKTRIGGENFIVWPKMLFGGEILCRNTNTKGRAFANEHVLEYLPVPLYQLLNHREEESPQA